MTVNVYNPSCSLLILEKEKKKSPSFNALFLMY